MKLQSTIHIIISPPIRKSKPIIANGRPLRSYSPNRLCNVDVMNNPFRHWNHTVVYPGSIPFHEFRSVDRPKITWWSKDQQLKRLNVNPEINDDLCKVWESKYHQGSYNDCIYFASSCRRQEIFRSRYIPNNSNSHEKINRSEVRSGDIVVMTIQNLIKHYAIYLADDLYLSKLGSYGPICVSSFSQLVDLYETRDLYRLIS